MPHLKFKENKDNHKKIDKICEEFLGRIADNPSGTYGTVMLIRAGYPDRPYSYDDDNDHIYLYMSKNLYAELLEKSGLEFEVVSNDKVRHPHVLWGKRWYPNEDGLDSKLINKDW